MYGFYWVFEALIPIGFLVGLVWLIVHLTRNKTGDRHSTAQDFKRMGVGAAITIILPFFIGFLTSAIFDQLEATKPFVMMVALALLLIIVALFISHHTVISYSLITGSIISLVYSTALNFETVNPKVMAVFAGIALAIVIGVAVKKLHDKEVI